MLKIIYFSNVTENTHRFVKKLDLENIVRIPIQGELDNDLNEPYVLITPTYGSLRSGYLPRQVKKFLHEKHNQDSLTGVIGSGNINFGDEYALAADIISNKFQVPVLYRFELAGTTKDIEKVNQGLKTFENSTYVLKT